MKTFNFNRMKKYFALLLLPLAVACSKGPKEAVLAGKLVNSVDKSAYITSNNVTDTIKLADDGTFTYKVMLNKPQLYKLNVSRTQTVLYLAPGDSSYIEFDVSAPLDGPTFSADNKDIHSNIFKRKMYIRNNVGNWRGIYGLDLEAFTQKIDSLQNALNSMIDSLQSDSKDIISLEKERVKYQILSFKANYPEYNSYFSGKPFSVDSADYSFLDDVNMNLGDKLMFDDYADLVSKYLQLKMEKDVKLKGIEDKDAVERLPIEFHFIDSLISDAKVRDFLKMQKLEEEIQFGDFYRINSIVDSYLTSCQTPAFKDAVSSLYNKKMTLAPGQQAPVFTYNDINGKPHSLTDFAGKLVYIDFWATWCGPCRHELPFLEQLQDAYKGKNIVFVSVSLDDNFEAWKKMEEEKEMKGVQLHADGAWASDVAKKYQIKGIPTFFLVGADGTIIAPNAPRPSSDEIKPLLNEELSKL